MFMTAADLIAQVRSKAKGKPGNCLTNSAPDEPVFTLVGRDQAAADTIRDWVQIVRSRYHAQGAALSEALQLKLADALITADKMDEWRVANGGGKLPD